MGPEKEQAKQMVALALRWECGDLVKCMESVIMGESTIVDKAEIERLRAKQVNYDADINAASTQKEIDAVVGSVTR